MFSKLNEQIYLNEFESHGVSHLYGLVPNLSKILSKLILYSCLIFSVETWKLECNIEIGGI